MSAEKVRCGACGKDQPPRALVTMGGFYPQPEVWGEWWRTHFIPTTLVCRARLACMRRIYGSGYTLGAHGEIPEQHWQADFRRRTPGGSEEGTE